MGKLYGYVKKDLDKYAKIDEITTSDNDGGVTDMGVPTAPTLTPITTEINFLPINYDDFYGSLSTELSMKSYVNSETGIIDTSANNIQSDDGKYAIGLGMYIYFNDGVTEQQKEAFYQSLSIAYTGGFITNNGNGNATHSVYKAHTTYNSSVNTYHLVTTLNFFSDELFTNSISSDSLKLSSDVYNLVNDPLVNDIFIDVFKVRSNPLVKTISNSNNDNVAIIGVMNSTSNGTVKASEVEKRFEIKVDSLDNTKINIQKYQSTINDKIQQNIPSNTMLLYSLY